MDFDLLNPSYENEKEKHKLKRLVQAPNSYFMDIRCPNCQAITTIFSHAQTIVNCEGFFFILFSFCYFFIYFFLL